ncbi:MAG: hypothetical protein FJ308_06165 [Planctomycetes bacterium]|nr:hypothetical protein [Planctomycetota bacterium]
MTNNMISLAVSAIASLIAIKCLLSLVFLLRDRLHGMLKNHFQEKMVEVRKRRAIQELRLVMRERKAREAASTKQTIPFPVEASEPNSAKAA